MKRYHGFKGVVSRNSSKLYPTSHEASKGSTAFIPTVNCWVFSDVE